MTILINYKTDNIYIGQGADSGKFLGKTEKKGYSDSAHRMQFIAICFVIVVCITVTEILTYPYVRINEFPFLNDSRALARVIVWPNIINYTTLAAGFLFCKFSKYSEQVKNNMVCVNFFVLCVSVECYHYYFPTILCSGCVAILISSFYGSKKLAKILSLFSFVAILAANVISYNDLGEVDGDLILNSTVAGIITFFTFMASMLLAERENERTKKIYESYLMENELSEKMKREPMTGLYNKKYFFEQLTEYTENPNCEPLQLIIIDIDNFKQINDTYGHACGDDVLLALAELLKKYTASKGCPARYGGEEFAILLPKTNSYDAVEIAELIRMEFRSLKFDFLPLGYYVTLCCGVAEFKRGTDGTAPSAIQLFTEADSSLYEAKKAGKNRTVLYGKTE